MTSLKFPAPGDWHLSGKILEAAANAIDGKFAVSRDYHIPYLAGYSTDGKKIYIDSRMPAGFTHAGRWVKTDRFLELHEAVEKTLLDGLGIIYQFAHQIALRTELAAVKAAGIDVEAYNKFMAHWIAAVEHEGYENLPPDLDMTPYEHEGDA